MAEAFELDLDDPETLARLEDIVGDITAEQQAERSARRAEYTASWMKEEVGTYGEEAGLDAETVAALAGVVTGMAAEFQALREAAMNGEMSWQEMRAERDGLRGETLTSIEELIGAERTDELADRIHWLGTRH